MAIGLGHRSFVVCHFLMTSGARPSESRVRRHNGVHHARPFHGPATASMPSAVRGGATLHLSPIGVPFQTGRDGTGHGHISNVSRPFPGGVLSASRPYPRGPTPWITVTLEGCSYPVWRPRPVAEACEEDVPSPHSGGPRGPRSPRGDLDESRSERDRAVERGRGHDAPLRRVDPDPEREQSPAERQLLQAHAAGEHRQLRERLLVRRRLP